MTIDIDRLTEAELIDLNNRIVERLKFLHQMRAHVEMLEFSIGDRVEFQPDGHPLVVGMLTRYNKKTVTVITDASEHWNVLTFVRRSVLRKEGNEGVRNRSRTPKFTWLLPLSINQRMNVIGQTPAAAKGSSS